jgi:putative transposon-encoded protein
MHNLKRNQLKKLYVILPSTFLPNGESQGETIPDEYIGRRVWIKVNSETLFIESCKKVIAQYQIKHDRLDEPR